MSEWQLRRPPYPEGAAGHVDLPPGDDQRVFDRLAGDVHAEEGAVAVVRDLDVDREALRILPGQKQDSKRWIVDDANYSLMMFALMAERGGGRCKVFGDGRLVIRVGKSEVGLSNHNITNNNNDRWV